MQGDYFYEGDKLRLQNFYVESPMADVILDGTFDKSTGVLDFVVEGKDLSLKRIQAKLPENYKAEGHATFEGIIKGTVDNPIFTGYFNAPAMNLNGVSVTNATGEVEVSNSQIIFENFGFNQDDGVYKMRLNINKVTKNLDGLLTVHNADISNLLALADAQSLPITGDLESTINVGGRLGSPVVELKGSIPQGEIGGCDIHGVELEVNLHDKRIYFNKLRGFRFTSSKFRLQKLGFQSSRIFCTARSKRQTF